MRLRACNTRRLCQFSASEPCGIHAVEKPGPGLTKKLSWLAGFMPRPSGAGLGSKQAGLQLVQRKTAGLVVAKAIRAEEGDVVLHPFGPLT